MSFPLIQLEKVCGFFAGNAWKSEGFSANPSGIPVIRIQNVSDDVGDLVYWDGEYDPRYIVRDGDILLSLSGNIKLSVWKRENALLNQRVVKLIPSEQVDRGYFYWAISRAIEEIASMAKHAVIANVSMGDLRGLQIPLPPLPEQKRIAAILDTADSIRRKRQDTVRLTEKLLRSVFLDMFGDPVTNPKGWKITKFENVGSLDRGVSKHRPRNAPQLLGGPYPLIQTGEVANSDGYIRSYKNTYSEIGLKQSKIWPASTLCITIAANIAKTGILTFDACFPDSVVGFTPNSYATTEFVQYWLSFLQKILEDSALESAQKNINLEILRNLDITLPPIELQTEFSKYVKRLHELKAKQTAGAVDIEYLFNSLLQRTFKGYQEKEIL